MILIRNTKTSVVHRISTGNVSRPGHMHRTANQYTWCGIQADMPDGPFEAFSGDWASTLNPICRSCRHAGAFGR